MADKPEKEPEKTTKRKKCWFPRQQEIFETTKLVIETTWSKPLGIEVAQTAKRNQISLALCL